MNMPTHIMAKPPHSAMLRRPSTMASVMKAPA
jgi:hypothetical protein